MSDQFIAIITPPPPIPLLYGPQGETGPMGPQGMRGDRGLQGEHGLQGETGPMGPQGMQGVTGPQGEDGQDGDEGPIGPEGPQGKVGAKGPKGDKGEKGDRGLAGPIGKDGPQGLQGLPGRSRGGGGGVPPSRKLTINSTTYDLSSDRSWTVSGGGAVDSVNGQTGVVVLGAVDLAAVPTSRTLTINGTSYDLSANRSWTVGSALTVKDVDGTPTVANVATIRFPNGTVTDDGGGQVTIGDLPLLDAANIFSLGPNLFKAGADGNVALAARRHSSGATGNIIEAQDENGAAIAYINTSGGLIADRIGIGVNGGNVYGSGYDEFLNAASFDIQPSAPGNSFFGFDTFFVLGNAAFSDFHAALIFGFDTGSATALGSSGSATISGILGFTGHSSAVAISQLMGGDFSVGNYNGSGAIDWQRGVRSYVYHQGGSAGAVANAAAFVGLSPQGSSWGSTNLYGLYLESYAGHSTNEYAMYTSGGAHRFGDYLDLAEISTPGSPSNTHGRLFCRDNAGKTELCIKYTDGTVHVLDSQP